MILSRTPLRISLVGGGTDVPNFYRNHGGGVVSMTINQFVHISVNDKFDGRTRVSYSVTENVDNPADLKHDLVRECLNSFDVKGLEITCVSDIPGEGSGLGSSSAFTVGLLAALSRKCMDKIYPAKMLAETAHTIEAKLCKHPGIGKQDQYASAFGGLHYYEFSKDEAVGIVPIFMTPEQKEYLESHLLLLYTGITRSATDILRNQEKNLSSSREAIAAGCQLREMACDLAIDLGRGDFHKVGTYLFLGWKLKRRLSDAISNPEIDRIHDSGVAAGAIGGKLLGAGGGGFFLFFADPKLHADIRTATELREVEFKIEEKGSEIVYDSRQN